MRLNKYLALCGLGSRRKCDEIIAGGDVSINGELVIEMGSQVEEGDVVKVGGVPINAPQEYGYYVFNKPAGCICSNGDTHGRPTIYDHLPEEFAVYNYVGRLDLQSRGLILLTNDGDLQYRLTHPKYQILRKYAIWLDRIFEQNDAIRVERGLVLEDGDELLPAKVKIKGKMIELTLKEGKNREIRRMMETLGYSVRDLKRVEFAKITLGDIKKGTWRELSQAEVASLYASVNLA